MSESAVCEASPTNSLAEYLDDVFGIDEFREIREVIDGIRKLVLTDRERAVLDRWTDPDDTSLDWSDLAAVLQYTSDSERARYIALLELGSDRLKEFTAANLTPSGPRSTKAEMAKFRYLLHRVLEQHGPMTVRGAFYQMVGLGLPKTEAQYDRVQRESANMRRGLRLPVVPYGWVVDGTRWMRKPRSHSSLASMLEDSIRTYRRAVWQDQDAYVEIWCEKDALSGVLHPVTAEWDVPLMVSRGYSSISFLTEAAMEIEAQEKPAYIYLFTDGDRSGGEIADAIERDLQQFAPGADIHCVRAAVTEKQVEELSLPTRPAKKKGDPPAVELDAIPSEELRRIVRDCIERHVDPDVLDRTQAAEAAERDTLVRLSETLKSP